MDIDATEIKESLNDYDNGIEVYSKERIPENNLGRKLVTATFKALGSENALLIPQITQAAEEFYLGYITGHSEEVQSNRAKIIKNGITHSTSKHIELLDYERMTETPTEWGKFHGEEGLRSKRNDMINTNKGSYNMSPNDFKGLLEKLSEVVKEHEKENGTGQSKVAGHGIT